MTAFRPLTLAAALLMLPALAGCSRHEPEAAPAETNMTEEDATVAPAPVEPAPAPEIAPSAAPTVAGPEETPVAPDEQMREDADATGMTARAERGEAAGDTGSDRGGDTGSAAANVQTE